eukprot:scaffold335461_cov32-Prasinocladus_malaysianus.AAC.1
MSVAERIRGAAHQPHAGRQTWRGRWPGCRWAPPCPARCAWPARRCCPARPPATAPDTPSP